MCVYFSGYKIQLTKTIAVADKRPPLVKTSCRRRRLLPNPYAILNEFSAAKKHKHAH